MSLFGNRRSIDIDIIAHDKSTRVFDGVGDGMSKMALKVNNGIIELNKGLHRYNSSMRGINRTTQLALAGAGYSVYKFTKESINAFADFERQHAKTMGAIASNYGKTASEQERFLNDQKRLKEESIALGTIGPTGRGALYNPYEVSFAQTELAKSGVDDPNEISKAMPNILKFAGGNDLDIETATTYAVNLSSMFDLAIDEWGLALDKVTKTADMSAIDVPDVFNSLKYAGPIGSQLGRDLEEILAMVGIMGNAGLRGSVAGTGIQSFYTKLLSPIGKSGMALESAPTDRVLDIFTGFTDNVMDENGKMKSGPDMSEMLTIAMQDLDDQEQAWFAHKLFGLYQMKAGFTLSKPGTGDLMRDVIDEIENNSAGVNDDKWEIMLETTYGRRAALSNAIFGIKTDVGYRLAPITKAITDELFKVLADGSNYNIDFGRLRESINEASAMIEEQYGTQLAQGVNDLANLGIDAGRVALANTPLMEGFAGGILKLLSGDMSGAVESMGNNIERANEKIAELPDELQPFAENVRDVTLALMALASVNTAAKLMESITTIWRSTIGQIIKAANMNVSATNVVLTNTGIVDKNGDPIYKQEVKPTSGGGSAGGGSVITDVHGKPIVSGAGPGKSSPGGSVFVDKNGNPIGSAPAPTPKKGLSVDKLKTGVNMATWAYSIGEMTGANNWLLDKMGVDGKSRENVDKVRTGANYAITATTIDSLLLKGAGKKLIASAGKSVVTGASGALTTIGTTIGATTAAIGGGMIAIIAGGIVAGALYASSKQNYKTNDEMYDGMQGNSYISPYLQTWYDSQKPMQGPQLPNTEVTSAIKSLGSQQAPIVNVRPPMVNVDVKVDKSGNVSTNKYINGYLTDAVDDAFRLGNTRTGR